MYGSKWACLVLTLLLAFSSVLSAQTSRPAEPELTLEPRAISLELFLIDRTGMVESAPQHGEGAMPSEAEFLLRGATVELTSFTPDADEVVTKVETDWFRNAAGLAPRSRRPPVQFPSPVCPGPSSRCWLVAHRQAL